MANRNFGEKGAPVMGEDFSVLMPVEDTRPLQLFIKRHSTSAKQRKVDV